MTIVMDHATYQMDHWLEQRKETVMTSCASPTIDIREIHGPARCDAILAAFDGLVPGDSLVVVGNGEPRDILDHLRVDRKGMFEWSPLETGPSCFRIALTRRAAARGVRREVTEALAWDHDRLDSLERQAFDLFASGDVPGAEAAWREFSVGLTRHIRFEEQILFPTFEDKSGFSPTEGPTAVMRAEHREIEQLIDAIGRAFSGDGAAHPLRAELHDVLGGHNMKEEQILYPGTDQRLDPDERDALVARIQAS
jgi:uncharacterized protein (DUF2249 family)